MKKNILILCTNPAEKGGVASYYSLVRKHFSSKKIHLDFYYTGNTRGNFFMRILRSLTDLTGLLRIVRRYDLVILNPSLDPKALIRDGVYHFFAKRIFHRKTLIFFHGWNIEFERWIDKYGRKLFAFFFNPDRICVLASQFKQTLISWDIDPEKIVVETTMFEQHKYDIDKDPFKIVFLARFIKGKGCLEAIQTVEALSGEFPEIKLYMVGEGELMPVLRDYVVGNGLVDHVEFTGWLEGERKYLLLEQCGIMLYPTDYGEGMPIILLEGMGVGLAIVTRPVAGIPDILVDGENGYLIESLDPKDFASKIKYLFQHKEIWQSISDRNRLKAAERFEIKNVVKRLEKLYLETSAKIEY